MRRSLALSILTFAALLSTAMLRLGADESYKGVFFTMPQGWTSGMQDGHFMVVPEDMTDETGVVIVLYGAEKLGGKSMEAWFKARMARDLDPQAKVLNDGETKSTNVGALKMFTTARAVQEAEGGIRIKMYHAVTDGNLVAMALGVTASEKAIDKYSESIRALFESLRFTPLPDAGPNPSTGPGAASSPVAPPSKAPQSNSPESDSKPITVSDMAGYWVHSKLSCVDYIKSGVEAGTLTSGYGKEYTFARDGSYTYFIDSAIVTRSLTVTESDSGKWGIENNKLVLRSKERENTINFHIIEYRKAPDGTTFLTLLNDMYELTAPNINDYGNHFVRVADKKTSRRK